MARSCGLRIGPRRFELVVLEGSARKHKFVAHSAGDLPRDADGAAVAQALVDALREANVPRDNVGVAVDAGLAAFRSLKLPFSDREKIEEVLKFEVENQLPQWNVDDVVVDYLVQEESPDQSELLVTAVRKEDLRAVLAVCEKAGIEPQEAELETSAMVNAAFAAGVCEIDKAHVLVHVGESSTSVVVVDGRKVREMRAIRIGAMTHSVAQTTDADAAPAADAPTPTPASPAESARRHEAAIQRIRRELARTVSSARTVHPVEAVYVCGQELPGLVGSRLQDVEVRRLEVLPADSGITAEDAGPLVVAYGAAVRQLGGGELQPRLRREELRYAGVMERVELPLAVAALLAVTLMSVWFIFLHKEQGFLDERLNLWSRYTQAFLLGDPRAGSLGYLVHPSDKMRTYIQKIDQDDERTPIERLQYVNGQLKEEIKNMEKELGQDAEITQPQSALAGASLVLAVLETQLTEENRPSIRKLHSTYTIGRQGKGDYVRVLMDVSFFAADAVQATQNYEEFVKALQSRPWCLDFERRPSTTLENSKGIFVAGMGIDVDVTKANLEKLNQ